MTIDRDNATWKLAVKAVSPDYIPTNRKVGAVTLDWTDSKGQKALLTQCFGQVFKELASNHEGNFRCFNVDHADNTPSMVFDSAHGHFHCYGCMDDGHNIDVFDVIKEVYQFQNFPQCFTKAIELYSEQPEYYRPIVTSKQKTPMFPKPMYKTMLNPYYHKITDDVYGLKYMESRGITRETCVQHGLMTWEYRGWWFIVFVNDNGTVVRRRFAKTDDARGYADEPPKWWNQAGDGGFFNFRAIDLARPKSEIVFVTESAIDALSIAQMGFHAVGLNSVNRFKRLHNEANYDRLCVLFDNDDTGRSKGEIVKQYGYYVHTYTRDTPFLRTYKDVNEALVANPKETRADIEYLNTMLSTPYKEQ